MGIWGSSLFANDTTCDVRDAYMKYLEEQLNNQEAFDKIMSDYKGSMGDEDVEPLFWFALAETQWEVGRLILEVKEKALEWIEKEGGVALWEDSGVNSEGWKKTLKKLKEKLESPIRSEKKIHKPEAINQNLWNVGDVYAYQLHTEKSKEYGTYGKFIILQKIGERTKTFSWMSPEEVSRYPMLMVIHVFNKLFDETPVLGDVEGVRLLPMGGYAQGKANMSRLVELTKKKHYPEEELTYLGTDLIPPNNLITPTITPISWEGIEESLNYCFKNFHDREYMAIEEGVFIFKDSE